MCFVFWPALIRMSTRLTRPLARSVWKSSSLPLNSSAHGGQSATNGHLRNFGNVPGTDSIGGGSGGRGVNSPSSNHSASPTQGPANTEHSQKRADDVWYSKHELSLSLTSLAPQAPPSLSESALVLAATKEYESHVSTALIQPFPAPDVNGGLPLQCLDYGQLTLGACPLLLPRLD